MLTKYIHVLQVFHFVDCWIVQRQRDVLAYGFDDEVVHYLQHKMIPQLEQLAQQQFNTATVYEYILNNMHGIATDDNDGILDHLDVIWYRLSCDEINYYQTHFSPLFAQLVRINPGDQPMNIFDNKEQYQALRAFWRNFIAQGLHKPVPEPIYTYTQREPIGYHQVSPLQCVHHLIYLAALGKDLKRACAVVYPDTVAEIGQKLHSGFALFGGTISPEQRVLIAQRIEQWLAEK